jgi:Tol biopolymer transport system component
MSFLFGVRGIVLAVALALAWIAFPTVVSAVDSIYVMRPDGSGVRKVAHVEGCSGHRSPQWSHDGKWIAFDASPGNWDQGHWYIVNVDGTGLKEMGEHDMPHWSPDDKQLLFENYGNGGAQRGVWVQNIDGKGLNWIVAGYGPRWSPDGSRIAYTDHRSVKSLDLVEGSELVLHSDAFERVYPGFDWSPDGKRLAFVGERNQRRELVIVDNQETRVRLVRPNIEGYVGWSPDGKRLVVTIMESLWTLDPDGDQAPRPVPRQIERNRHASWSPDGQWLVFSSNRKSR